MQVLNTMLDKINSWSGNTLNNRIERNACVTEEKEVIKFNQKTHKNYICALQEGNITPVQSKIYREHFKDVKQAILTVNKEVEAKEKLKELKKMLRQKDPRAKIIYEQELETLDYLKTQLELNREKETVDKKESKHLTKHIADLKFEIERQEGLVDSLKREFERIAYKEAMLELEDEELKPEEISKEVFKAQIKAERKAEEKDLKKSEEIKKELSQKHKEETKKLKDAHAEEVKTFKADVKELSKEVTALKNRLSDGNKLIKTIIDKTNEATAFVENKQALTKLKVVQNKQENLKDKLIIQK